MSDTALASMLVHRPNVYHLVQTTDADGQLLESYPGRWSPDIANLPALITMDQKALVESTVGYLIGSTAIMYCEDADIRERDRIHFGHKVLYVNGTPAEFVNPWGVSPMTPHLLMIGLKEDKEQPSSL